MPKSGQSASITRRGFLRGAATAAVALPTIVPSSVFGRYAPSNRVTVGKIGCGGRGGGIGGVGGQVVAACDCWENRRQAWADRIKGKGYADYRELLARGDIDAVAVASTDHWHVHHTIAAARAGKDVYCEKPLGVSLQEDIACREAIHRYGRTFQYGTQQRSSRHCRFGCELVRSGYIGEVKELFVKAPDSAAGNSYKPQPVPPGLDYEMWLGRAPWRPYCGQAAGGGGWWHDYDYAIGFIAGWGAHPLDILQWGYDTHLTGLWEVEGKATIPTTGRNNVVMRWDVDLRFANGVKMKFVTGGDYTKFTGTEGWVAISRGGIWAEPASLLKLTLKPDDVHLQVSRGHGQNFAESVKTRRQPVSNIDDAVRSDTISHVSDIAIRLGRKVVWDPAKEEFPNDPDATRRFGRAYREPWGL